MDRHGTKESWNNYWDENRNKKTFLNSLISVARKYYFAKEFARFIAKNYNIKNKSICEIGVGSGLTLSWLKKMGAENCVGVDYSEEALDYARSFDSDCEFVLGNAFNLSNIPDKKFDLVYSLGFLEHFEKSEQHLLIEEQKRIAKECVFIEVPYDIFYFRWLFLINRKIGRITTFSDEELFTNKTFLDLGLKGETKLMPRAFFLTISHIIYL